MCVSVLRLILKANVARKLDEKIGCSTQQTVYLTLFLIISAETAKIARNSLNAHYDNRFIGGSIPERTHVIRQVFKCQFTCHQKLSVQKN